MLEATPADVTRMRDQLLFEGDDIGRRLTRYWLLLILAAIIASAGVVGDSTATVIGAMIVAPLMAPILGTVLSIVLADRSNLIRCVALVVAGSAAVVAIGYLIGLAVHESIVAATNAQVATRVSPRLIDLIAALATGAVGSIALARDDISDIIPGVAIAVSLVPPLAVIGLTLESGAPDQALGAFLLFVTNVTAILTSGLIVMSLYRVNRAARQEPDVAAPPVNRRHAAVVIVASLLVISAPLAFSSYRIAQTETDQTKVSDLADAWAKRNGWEIESVTSQPGRILVRATGSLPDPETATLEDALTNADLGDTRVTLELIPSHTVNLNTDNG